MPPPRLPAGSSQVQALQAENASLKRKLGSILGDVPECSICLDAVTYPVELQECRHLYCCQCFYEHSVSRTLGSRACPVCRADINKAPLPPTLPFLEYLERVKTEKRLQEEQAAREEGERGGIGRGAASGGRRGGQGGGGGAAAVSPTLSAAGMGGAMAADGEIRGEAAATAAAAASAATAGDSVERQTHKLQLEELRLIFKKEQDRRDCLWEEEEEEDGLTLFDATENVYFCVQCNAEVGKARAHVCGISGAEEEVDPNEPVYCTCRRVAYGQMLGCDNKDCTYGWFHVSCVGLLAPPTGSWLCPDCRAE